MGKTQLHPIFITLGNIPSWQRNKKDAKVLLGYMPIIQSKNHVLFTDGGITFRQRNLPRKFLLIHVKNKYKDRDVARDICCNFILQSEMFL